MGFLGTSLVLEGLGLDLFLLGVAGHALGVEQVAGHALGDEH